MANTFFPEEFFNHSVLVSMGDFQNYGGWSLDTQFVPTMGVPYLLAHGLGKPVEDATTTIRFPSAGRYYMYVYTYNWVAPWKPEYAPGTFQIRLAGETLAPVFGVQGSDWAWQPGGFIDVCEGETELALCDMTGFEARCGLVLFTADAGFVPESGVEAVVALHRSFAAQADKSRDEEVSYDFVVAGGGIAGMCCALSAARKGLKTALVQDRAVLGGNNSSEVRVWLGGETGFEPYPGLGRIVRELEPARSAHYGCENTAEIYEDERRLALLQAEPNLTVYLSHILLGAVTENGTIQSIEMLDIKNNRYTKIRGDLFADCTGDATLGALAGADYEVTTNGHMGMTNLWCVKDTGEPQEFPNCPWAIDLSNVAFPGRAGVSDVYGGQGEKSLGVWFWESGCESDPILKAEYIRDINFRAMYGAWDCLKNIDQDYPNHELHFAAYIGGKRESRRLLGDVLLTKCEMLKGIKFEDRCVPVTWSFDVHYPDKRFYAAFHEGDGFITKDYHEKFDRPYFIPYRCLYSRNIGNLFMAGRNISVSHDALGPTRVMRTTGMMGEAIGEAAYLCKLHTTNPRDIYETHLEELVSALKSLPVKE